MEVDTIKFKACFLYIYICLVCLLDPACYVYVIIMSQEVYKKGSRLTYLWLFLEHLARSRTSVSLT